MRTRLFALLSAYAAAETARAYLLRANYFVRNQARIFYPELSDHRLLIGSGAMESGIRSVVKLRMKVACLYWLK